MKAPRFNILGIGIGAVALAAVLSAVIKTPSQRPASSTISPTAAPALASRVAANGFALASASVELPDDTGVYPDGPHADAINGNCTACHSASMALSQPVLSADQWKAEVTKMREVYKAPVPESAVPAIVAYLVGMPSQKTAPTSAEAQNGVVRPNVAGGAGGR